MVQYEFIYSFTKTILGIDNSIRWVCVTDKQGTLINERYRQGVKPLMDEDENEEYASNAISRQRTRVKFEPKIGKLVYALGKYEKVYRATIPINDDYYLLLTIDREAMDVDRIFMTKVIPMISELRNKFVP